MDANTFAGPRAFARFMLRDDRLLIRPVINSISVFGSYCIEAVLFRDACWQVELVTMLPGAVVPKHRHNRVDSCDLLISGWSPAVVIGGKSVKAVRHEALLPNLVRIGKGVWHEGQPERNGAVYLSFQKWDGEPGLISEDWDEWQPDSK